MMCWRRYGNDLAVSCVLLMMDCALGFGYLRRLLGMDCISNHFLIFCSYVYNLLHITIS